MSSKTFKVTVDTEEVKKSEKEVTESFNNMQKAAEKSGKAIDQKTQLTKEGYKIAIKEQKAFIEGLEKEIAEMKKARDAMAPGRAKSEANREIAAANRTLKESQQELNVLQKEYAEVTEAVEVKQSSLIKTMSKMGAGLFAATAAFKIFKGIIESTTATKIEFEKVTAAATSGVQYFFKTIASGDWTNFGHGLKEAIKGAAEFVEKMEDLHNRKNEQDIRSAKYDKEIAELRDKTYDKSSENDQSRLQALRDIMALQKLKYEEEAKIAEDTYRINLEKAARDSGLSQKKIEQLLQEYTSLQDLIELGKKYNELTRQMNKAAGFGSPELVMQFKDQRDAMGLAGKEAGQYVQKIIKVGMDTRTSLSGYLVDQIKAETAYGEKNRAYKMQEASLENKIKEEAKENARQRIELERSLAEARVRLKLDTEKQLLGIERDSAEKMRKQAELNYKEQIAELDRLKAETIKKQNMLSGGLTKEGYRTASYYGGLTGEEAQLDKDARLAAEKAYQQSIILINEDAAKEIRRILRESSESFLTDQEKALSDLNIKFDEYVKAAKLAGATDIDIEQIEKGRASAIAKVNQESADELKKIQRQIAQEFMDETERQISAINEKYDTWIKRAKEVGATEAEIAEMEKARQKDIDNASMAIAQKVTKYWKEAFGAIDTYGTYTIKKLLAQTGDIIENATETKVKGKTHYIVSIPDIDAEGKAVERNVTLTIEEFNQLQKKYGELDKMVKDKNPFKAMAASWKTFIKSLQEGDKEAMANAMQSFSQSVESADQYIQSMGEAFANFVSDDNKKDLMSLMDLLGGVSDTVGGIAKLASGDILKGVLGVVSGIGGIYNMLIEGMDKAAEEALEITKAIYKASLDNQILLLEQLRESQSSLDSAFITDYTEKILNAAKVVLAAEKKLDEAIRGMFEVQDRTRLSTMSSSWNDRMFELNNYEKTLKGYLEKLQVVVGSVETRFLGFLWRTGSEPIYDSLLKKYPELINSAGRLNIEVAKNILAMGNLLSDTEKGLTALIEFEEEVQASLEAIREAISAMAGQIGTDLFSSLATAWDEGTDAFTAFKLTVTKGLKDIISQMIYNKVFAAAFKDLEAQMALSFGVNGDQSIVDDLKAFFEKAPALLEAWNTGMKEAEEAAAAVGLDWASLKEKPQGMSGIVRTITEETGTELVGLMRRIADDNTFNRDYNKQSVDHLVNIEVNTYLTVEQLKVAVTELKLIASYTKPVYSKDL